MIPKPLVKYCDLARQRHLDDGRVQVFKAKILVSLNAGKRRSGVCVKHYGFNPRCWEAHDVLGAELAQEGNFAGAQVEFEEVVRLQPGYAEGHLNLGIALGRQRRFADAVAEFNEALRLEPQNRKAQEFLSAVEQLQKQQP